MVNLARKVGITRRDAARTAIDSAPNPPPQARLAGRFPFYWLTIVAVLAVASLLLPYMIASNTPTAAARDGVRFNLLTIALALALSVGVGIARPRWWRRAVAILALGPVPILLVTSGNLAAGCATLLLAFVASWLGRELAASILGPLDCATGWITGATLGLGLIAACGFVAGTLGVLRPLTLWGVVTLAALGLVVAARKRLMREARGLALWLARPADGRLMHYLLAGAALACFWLNLLGALTPDLGSDAIRQRLATAAHFAQQGNLRADNPDLFVAREPAFGEITYAAIISVSSVQGTKLAHFLIGLLCAGAIFALGRQLGGPLAGGLGAFAFYTTVMAAFLSQTAYLDFFTTLFAVAPMAILLARRRPDWRVAILAGVCLGFGVATKLHFGYVAVGLCAALGLLALRQGGLPRACWLCAAMTGAALLAVAPWLLRSFSLTGQLQGLTLLSGSVTGGGAGVSSVAFDLPSFGFGRSWWALLTLPFTAFLLSGQFGGRQIHDAIGGHLGYLPLALPAFLVVGRRPRPVYPLVAGIAIATMAWFATAQYLRYGLPIIALVCALGGAAYATARQRTERGRSQAALHVVLAVVALAGVFARAQFPDIAHRYAFGLESREAFLDEHLAQQGAGSYALMRLLDSDPTVTRVLALHDGARLYTRAQISGIFTSGGDLASAADDATVSAKLRADGYSHIMLDRRTWAGGLFGWDRMTVVDEEFLRRHTTLVGGGNYSYLYRILSPAEEAARSAWTRGDELLPNGGFESGQGALPAGWAATGTPRYDRSGTQSHSGQGAVLLAQRDTITTTVAVQPGSSYLIATASKGESAYGFLQTRVEWRDSAGRLIGSEGEDTPVTPLHYQGFSTLVTAPTGAVAATISLQPTVSATWVDEVSLRAVTPDGGAAAAPAVGR